MKLSALSRVSLAALLLAGIAAPALLAQRTGFTPGEFVRRRAALMDQVKDGAVILFGDASVPPGTHFRQDNDFFYFTGNDDLGGALVLVPSARGGSYLFLPQRSAREIQYDGPGLLESPEAKAKAGFTDVLAVGDLDEFLARLGGRGAGKLYVRLSPRDTLDDARSETALMDGRRSRSHYNAQLSVDQDRIAKLRERYPQMEFVDIAPAIDGLRAIKTAEEIEIMRRNGALSAAAVKQAMLAGRPGVFEYEIEAAAMGVVLKGGAKGSVVHELAHVVQNYGVARRTNPSATRTPGWVVEG
ncbi:MAG TPA: aminopeptidase P N-terminal domain-containing protein, partial [Candidatus Bathyarchaeia archaeon]|nr:aminopeptidase P N-terminal domain-containing protein [Candidatus Bathyarchaeia archaeon]